jgi:hypothetical protein
VRSKRRTRAAARREPPEVVDTVLPEDPVAGVFVATATPSILVTDEDDRSGVDPFALQVWVDGVDRTARFTADEEENCRGAMGVLRRVEGVRSRSERTGFKGASPRDGGYRAVFRWPSRTPPPRSPVLGIGRATQAAFGTRTGNASCSGSTKNTNSKGTSGSETPALWLGGETGRGKCPRMP